MKCASKQRKPVLNHFKSRRNHLLNKSSQRPHSTSHLHQPTHIHKAKFSSHNRHSTPPSRLSSINNSSSTPQAPAKSIFATEIERGVPSVYLGTPSSPFVDSKWLKDNLDKPIHILNTSWQLLYDTSALSVYQSFLSSRIPGATFLDLEQYSLASSHKPLCFSSVEQYAQALGRAGINNNSNIILYDFNGLLGAAYAHWLLTAIGVNPDYIRILSGGWLKWIHDLRNPIDNEIHSHTHEEIFIPDQNIGQHLVGDREMFDLGYAHHLALSNGFVDERLPIIIDTRCVSRFAGEAPEPVDFVQIRGGHIPGSINIPYQELVQVSDEGIGTVLKSPEMLTAVFAKVGLGPNALQTREFIVTSGTSTTAAVAALALRSLGSQSVRLYNGGWFVYGNLDKCYPTEPRPLEVGVSVRLKTLGLIEEPQLSPGDMEKLPMADILSNA